MTQLLIFQFFFFNFASMKHIIKTCNPTVIFSKFTPNKNIEEEFEGFLSKLVIIFPFSIMCIVKLDFNKIENKFLTYSLILIIKRKANVKLVQNQIIHDLKKSNLHLIY